MTAVANDTKDTKYAWLVSLDNMAISLSRLRNNYHTICPLEGIKSSKSNIDSIYTAEKIIDVLGLKLMDTWGIKRSMLWKWMDLGPGDYAKRMNWQGFIGLPSRSWRPGQTKRSRKK